MREYVRPGPHLTALTLEAANALLPPFGSHLRRWFVTAAKLLAHYFVQYKGNPAVNAGIDAMHLNGI